jgi:hypothetical protein
MRKPNRLIQWILLLLIAAFMCWNPDVKAQGLGENPYVNQEQIDSLHMIAGSDSLYITAKCSSVDPDSGHVSSGFLSVLTQESDGNYHYITHAVVFFYANGRSAIPMLTLEPGRYMLSLSVGKDHMISADVMVTIK